MKKLLTIIFIFSMAGDIISQNTDIGVPASSPFPVGTDIQGTIQNSVNEPTGKVTLSSPLGSISAGSVSYSIGLTYNGEASFKNGQQTNKYNPTGVVGVGWAMGTPKIVVDNKSTGTRDDDEFYLLDGSTSSKLICINRGSTANGSQWEFQLEKYAPWKIYFYHHNSWGDYWKIIKDDGLIYHFGNSASKDGKEFEVRYGNWIGSSKQLFGASEQTIVWNITKMEDQWSNHLTFNYEMVKQNMSGKDQTEASYLLSVSSSRGGGVIMSYGTKNLNEYYEPNIESAEPDAYQERYEKKFLSKVSSYNKNWELVSTYDLGYTLNGTGLNTKRYLTSLIQTVFKNGLSEVLPVQNFEYYYSGTFQGGIKKIIYPSGGEVSYVYNNKLLLNNITNQYEGAALIPPSGYIFHSVYMSNNYGIYVYRTQNIVSGDKYRFIFYRQWWNGLKWEWHEFIFPHLIQDPSSITQGSPLKDFYPVFEKDFYGFVYDKGTSADLYLFHLKNDNRTWHSYTHTSLNIGSENPNFVSSEGFVALQNHRGGQLYTYVWNGSSWNYKLINQGAGQYYIAARNNFIISLNEDGGNDMVTGTFYYDNYYFHYLDATKIWQTKSWTSFAYPRTNRIANPSYWYPDNSIIGFVADNNAELFFRWDTDYNLTNIDNVLGAYDDTFPLVPVGNKFFTIHKGGYQTPYKSARFNGDFWSVNSLPSSANYLAGLHFGEDIMLFQNHPMYTKGIGYHKYNPNTNSWTYSLLNNFTISEEKISILNKEFTIAGNNIYNTPNTGGFNQVGMLQYHNSFSVTDGSEHAIIMEATSTSSTPTYKNSFYSINKTSGIPEKIDLPNGYISINRAQDKFGYTPVISQRSLWLKNANSQSGYLHPIINNKINNHVYNIVVNHIDINDNNGTLGKIQYSYNKPKSLPDNSTTFYGEVIIENKGMGTGNIGKIVKLFNDGSTDLSMVGLPQEVLFIKENNKAEKRVTTTWNKYLKATYIGNSYFYNSYYIRPTMEKEELFFDNSAKIVNTTTHSYNTLGLKTSSTSINSNGKTVQQDITYAYQTYPFVNDKNMLVFPYQTTSKINNQIVNVDQIKWVNNNGKAYINENFTGPSMTTLRLNSRISNVLSNGSAVESNNGKGMFNSALFGYNHLFEVATINNATFQEVNNALDVNYESLQGLSTTNLKTELLKLYSRLPNAFINLKFYDNDGRVVNSINERMEEIYIYYDPLGRKDYITDAQGKILEKKNYHFGN